MVPYTIAGAVPKPRMRTIHGSTRIFGMPYTATTNGLSTSRSARTEPMAIPNATPNTTDST
jgi:hypothetical protein